MNMPAMVDCLESAVKKGRERLLEADRRNSDFVEELSFRLYISYPKSHRKDLAIEKNLFLKNFSNWIFLFLNSQKNEK